MAAAPVPAAERLPAAPDLSGTPARLAGYARAARADTPPHATSDLVDAGRWLELRCACERTTQVPHRPLVKAHEPLARVPALLARFRCRTCGRPPMLAGWIDNPAGGALGSGYPPKKRVPLAL